MFTPAGSGGGAAPKQLPPPGGSPAAPPPSGVQTTTPSFPGIPGILGSDPSYQGLLTMDQAMSGQDQATMNQRIAAMKSYYGSDTDPLSVLGRVYQAYQDQNRSIANTLTAHGMLNSGETGFQGARATLAYQQNELDSRMKLQQYIQGLQDAFQTAERNRQLGEWQASSAAIANWINNPANQPTSTGSAPDQSGGGTTPAAPAAPTTFSWGGQTWGHGEKAQFVNWLNAHGANYATWAAAHPGAAGLL